MAIPPRRGDGWSPPHPVSSSTQAANRSHPVGLLAQPAAARRGPTKAIKQALYHQRNAGSGSAGAAPGVATAPGARRPELPPRVAIEATPLLPRTFHAVRHAPPAARVATELRMHARAGSGPRVIVREAWVQPPPSREAPCGITGPRPAAKTAARHGAKRQEDARNPGLRCKPTVQPSSAPAGTTERLQRRSPPPTARAPHGRWDYRTTALRDPVAVRRPPPARRALPL